MLMAKSSRSLYYAYERSGSQVKHTQDEGCQPQLPYLLFTSKEESHTIFEKKLLNIKCVLIFSKTLKHFSFKQELREILS